MWDDLGYRKNSWDDIFVEPMVKLIYDSGLPRLLSGLTNSLESLVASTEGTVTIEPGFCSYGPYYCAPILRYSSQKKASVSSLSGVLMYDEKLCRIGWQEYAEITNDDRRWYGMIGDLNRTAEVMARALAARSGRATTVVPKKKD